MAKEKGFRADTVKDIIDGLVNDGLIKMDKIGCSNYFWSFPSEARHARERRIDEQTAAADAELKRKQALLTKVEEAKQDRVPTVSASFQTSRPETRVTVMARSGYGGKTFY